MDNYLCGQIIVSIACELIEILNIPTSYNLPNVLNSIKIIYYIVYRTLYEMVGFNMHSSYV